MAAASLTRGAIAAIVEGETAVEGLKPILQVVEVRPVSSVQSSSERFRMVLTDGVSHQQAMLATQMNGIVKSGALKNGSIVELTQYICNTIQNRRIIIILGLEIVSNENSAVGAGEVYDSSAATMQGRAPAPPHLSAADHSMPASGNAPSYGGQDHPIPAAGNAPFYGGPVAGQTMKREPSMNPSAGQVPNNQSYGSYGRNTSNLNALHSGVEQGVTHPSGGNQNQRFSVTGGGGYGPPVNNTYGRPGQPLHQQPPPLYSNRGPIAKNEAAPRIIPISALNPYQGRWTIKARVTAKGELRRYNNPRGEGKVFSFDLLDAEGGEIRVTCFNLVADQFYDQIEKGKVYSISKGNLKPAQKNFNHLNNDYEIFLENTSTIVPCSEEDTTIPKQQFNFKLIDQIEGMENNSTLDVIGIVSAVYPAGTIMTKNGRETFKRTLQLKDMSGRSVELTLWGNFCNDEGQQLQTLCESGLPPVLAVKAAKVNEFNGKSLGTISSSQLLIDPDFPEAHKLKEWYNREGKNMATPSISRESSSMGRTDVRKTVSQIKDEGLGRSEKPDWITVKATISFMKVENFCYTACPLMVGDRKCSKKVTNNGDGTWQCDRCDRSSPECEYRYLAQFQIQDHTGITWVTAFQEAGEEIIGICAKDLFLMKYEEQDEGKFAEIIRKVLFNQYLFKLKIKEETFSDEQRVKSTIVKAERVNPSSESRYLLGLIEKLSVEDPNAVSGIRGTFASGSQLSHASYGNMESKPFVHPVTNNFGTAGGADGYRVTQANQIGQHMNDYGGITHNSIKIEFCNNCGSAGHNFQNCPRAMNSQGPYVGGGFSNRSSNTGMGGNSGPENCYKCQQPGHWARDCPGMGGSVGPGMGGSAGSGTCYKCQQPGHWARDCPGVNTAPSVYGGSSKSGSYAKQHVGGY